MRNLQTKQFWKSRVNLAGSQFVLRLPADRVHGTIVIPESQEGQESSFFVENLDTKYAVVHEIYR